MTDKIKSCPFCGGEAHVEEHKFWNDITRSFDIKTYSVVCDECSSTSFQHYRIKQEAIKAWNTRKPMDMGAEALKKEDVPDTNVVDMQCKYIAMNCGRDCANCWKFKLIKPHWIPCSERFPECEWGAETEALMYQVGDSIYTGYFGKGGLHRDAYFRTYTDTMEGVDASDVIAWMPLPEPYKGE